MVEYFRLKQKNKAFLKCRLFGFKNDILMQLNDANLKSLIFWYDAFNMLYKVRFLTFTYIIYFSYNCEISWTLRWPNYIFIERTYLNTYTNK